MKGGSIINAVLQNLRRKHGLTLKDMATIINLQTASGYCKKELGYVPFSLEEAKVIADYFGKRIEDIFFTKELA